MLPSRLHCSNYSISCISCRIIYRRRASRMMAEMALVKVKWKIQCCLLCCIYLYFRRSVLLPEIWPSYLPFSYTFGSIICISYSTFSKLDLVPANYIHVLLMRWWYNVTPIEQRSNANNINMQLCIFVPFVTLKQQIWFRFLFFALQRNFPYISNSW